MVSFIFTRDRTPRKRYSEQKRKISSSLWTLKLREWFSLFFSVVKFENFEFPDRICADIPVKNRRGFYDIGGFVTSCKWNLGHSECWWKRIYDLPRLLETRKILQPKANRFISIFILILVHPTTYIYLVILQSTIFYSNTKKKKSWRPKLNSPGKNSIRPTSDRFM